MKKSFLMLLILSAAAAAHAESASVVREADLLEQSQSDATKLATLTTDSKVDVLRRLGAWTQVKTADGKTGWVRMTALKFLPEGGGQPAGKSEGGTLGALNNLLSAGRTSNSATVTTGVRGLTDEDLQNAQANPGELEKAKNFTADAQAAKKFANSSKLSVNQVEYLPSGSDKKSRSGKE